ncbi:MAG: hypothetical protein Q8S12_11020 [Hydrogenophaga sp.]|uniref:hypothetical protein n=1 Tax=Hydrogenophaga sp. TaxID=1904254 RepID=UPI002734B66B|nr:hypothetical protein [Hydrogenophaga sp.]MDP3627122.1 hypothetical protein [Hydrogenophaga sp.]
MTDRELLEAAARAAGIVGFWVDAGLNTRSNAWPVIWNPIVDDGDALRLAVKLQLQVTPGTYNKDEFTAFHAGRGEAHEYRHFQQDEFAATRRAIVRAAAEIGTHKEGA